MSDGFYCLAGLQRENKKKKSDEINKFFDLAKELKKKQTRKMKVKVIPIVIGVLGTISKALEKK